MEQKWIFRIKTEDLKDFEEMAKSAKKMGATHVMVGDLKRSRWMWEKDLTDPYTNWSMGHAQLFKLVCPPQLKPYLPAEHIAECMELVEKRCKILKQYGLKPALFSNEPFWLPEEAYRDHPEWRGARCDHPRRSKKPYYSPCIDQEEVLSMYRFAMKELTARTGIDFFTFMSNDSGGGLCWSSGTYVGPNGPAHCKNRKMSDRICGFLDALSDGARDSGVDAVIHFNTDIDFKAPETAAAAIWPMLKEHQLVNKKDCHGNEAIVSILDLGGPEKPILKIPRAVQFVQFLLKARKASAPYVICDIPRSDFEETAVCFEAARGEPLESLADCGPVLKKAAEKLAGAGYGGQLSDAWYLIEESYQHLSHTGLDLLMYGCQHQRWINRPFVLFPEELSEEDRSYYRRFQFQALTEEETNDLMNLQGIEGVRGFTSSFLITQTMNKAVKSMAEAISLLGKLESEEGSSIDKDKLELLIRRLKAESCFFRNIVNAVQFQELVDRTDFEQSPVLSLRWPTREDMRFEEFQNIVRAEVENAYALADVLEGYEDQLLLHTDAEHEDIFVFGPDFVKQLRRKAEIMLDHIGEGSRVYVSHNI